MSEAREMEDLPLEKIAISGPILASIIQRFSSSQGDVDGLLFGEITHPTPSNLLDDDDGDLSNSSTLIANITGFFCSGTLFSFYDPLGRIDLPALQRLLGGDRHLIGWFLGRRRTPLRPSMRESSVTASLSSNTLTLNSNSPSVFLLLSTPFSEQLIHTHEYKAFQFRHSTRVFEPKTMDVINIGPAFRGHYGAFSPNSPFPLMRPREKVAVEEEKETLVSLKRTAKEQQGLDLVAEGFEIGRLTQLMGKEAANYTSELEDLYGKMLAKLEGLARLVEKSSAMVNEQVRSSL
ncbi:hypothetical protein ACHQM5_020447 [Ranunculus cassubicifolius]